MSEMMPSFETRCLSSLAKVFAGSEIRDPIWSEGSALSNEIYSFQVAYRSERLLKPVRVRIVSDLQELVSVRAVGLVPSELPCYHDHDEHVLLTTPGLYPDPLFPVDGEGLTGLPGHWRSIWVEVDLQGKAEPGIHRIEARFETQDGELLGRESFELEVIGFDLPKQKLIHTEWFHTDCLASHYGVKAFSEKHWQRIDQFVQTAVKHGMNMILTPIFTPPLDTAIGEERLTVQLVDVEKIGKTYRFGFDKLKRWVELCSLRGIEYFEFSHLFTQWGAKHAPKIVANDNGELKRIFGWETDASGEEYKLFLGHFLPELIHFLKQNNLEQRSYFHVSDEPGIEHLESYRSASGIVRPLLAGFPIIDALSNFQYYEQGLVLRPIPASDHIQPFLDHGVPDLWTYYCCGQYKKVANRFFNMPSSRNRIIGIQLYIYGITGFLHWGYNFWYSQLSRKVIDPFRVTDAGCGFPSGDAFVVYPGPEGPIESIRLKVFYEALQDLRALQLLEELAGSKKSVIELLEEGLDKPITFSEYPREAQWLLAKREQINRKIAALIR